VLSSELSGFWGTFGEDDRKITKKAQTPEPAARAVCLRPYKTSEISNRLAGLRANEQCHQMCARAIVWRTISELFGVVSALGCDASQTTHSTNTIGTSSKSSGCRPPRHIHNPRKLMFFTRWSDQRIGTRLILLQKGSAW